MKRLLLVLVITACSEKKQVELKPPNLKNGAAEFRTRCTLCHGATGAGDGSMAASLAVKPRNFTDPNWQVSITDAQLDEVITKGGKAVGKSEMMPANFANDPQTLSDVRAYIRSLHGMN